jgi:hypothetical protein
MPTNMTPAQPKKLLDQVRDKICFKHYSLFHVPTRRVGMQTNCASGNIRDQAIRQDQFHGSQPLTYSPVATAPFLNLHGTKPYAVSFQAFV